MSFDFLNYFTVEAIYKILFVLSVRKEGGTERQSTEVDMNLDSDLSSSHFLFVSFFVFTSQFTYFS